jgi:hypothetical protein
MYTRRQWQKLFTNPFFILTVLVIFFLVGRLIIQSVNRNEENPIKSRVWQTVQAMNRVWTVENNPSALKRYFHPNMVALPPGDSLRICGQAACLAAWTTTAEKVRVISWKETDPQINIYGRNRFAIVTYHWEMEYETDGRTVRCSGRDMLSLIREHGRWWIVANQLYPSTNSN